MLDQNQQERFMRLWTIHQPGVANYLHALVRDRAAAEDLLQETALLIFRRFAEYDEQRPFVAWALGIARFKVLGMRRDKARCRVIFDDEALEKFTESWAEQASEPTARSEALESCIGKLADHAQRVVRLRYFEDMTADQIAAKLGGNGGSIRVTLQRIRTQLRECIDRQLRLEGGLS
jgi:RNA polymerase sigma-70 factor (ECF subfamily)